MTTVGVLALQGDVREHVVMLESLGIEAARVRRVDELADVDALVLPGGESTTIDKLLRAFELREPLLERLADGMPVLGSCAGMVLLASRLIDGVPDQQTLEAIPMTVRRNAFGRQVDSAEVDLIWEPDGSPMRATFIRAPWVESHEAEVEVLATATGPEGERHPVAVRYRSCVATAFHPEISNDTRVHRLFADLIG